MMGDEIIMVKETNFQRLIKKMKLTLLVMIVASTMFVGIASAFDPEDLQKLKDNNICIGCDLKSADLYKAALSRANLSNANLADSMLNKANLSGANLTHANLTETDLTWAILKGTTLCNTTMPDGSVNDSGC